MQSPFFSVIIPTYNRKEFLKKAINSVLEQTEKDWELLIVDDGSSDGSQPLKEEIAKEKEFFLFFEFFKDATDIRI